MLLDTIESVKRLDVGDMKLQVFEKEKAREMITQGALWMVDSRVDEVEGNEVSEKALTDRYWSAFEVSAKETLDKMPSEKRKEAEKLVRDDLKIIVQATSFVLK